MCGIAGFVELRERIDRDAALERRLRRMVDVIRHRGPDDRGKWTDGTCGLTLADAFHYFMSPDIQVLTV